MIKNYLPGRENACWGVSCSTHIPLMGDTPADRAAHNKVFVQIEDYSEGTGDLYARRPLLISEALQFASFIAGGILHLQMGKTHAYDAAADGYSVFADADGEVVISIVDTVHTAGKLETLAMPIEEAAAMVREILGQVEKLMARIFAPTPTAE